MLAHLKILLCLKALNFIRVAKSRPVMRILGLQLDIDVGSDLKTGASRVIRLIVWLLVVVVERWATVVVGWWLVIGIRVPVRRSMFVFVRWFMVRLWFIVGIMIWWCRVVIGVRLSIMFNLVTVMGGLQGHMISFALVVVAWWRWRWRRWRWWRWGRRGRWMVWLHMVLLGIMMTWLVVTMTMTIPMIFMNEDRGGSVGIMVVQRIVHCDHFIVVERLLNVVDCRNKLFLHHRLHHRHRFAIVGVLGIVFVVIVLVLVVVVIHHGHSSSTRGDYEGLCCQLISQSLSLLLSQRCKTTCVYEL